MLGVMWLYLLNGGSCIPLKTLPHSHPGARFWRVGALSQSLRTSRPGLGAGLPACLHSPAHRRVEPQRQVTGARGSGATFIG